MRRYLMFFAVACFVSAVLAAGAGYAQSAGPIVAWGYNYLGQCNVPSPNDGLRSGRGRRVAQPGPQVRRDDRGLGEQRLWSVQRPLAERGLRGGRGGRRGTPWALSPTGRSWPGGTTTTGQCNVPSPNADFVAVAAGRDHSLGLKSDGTIVAWGNNDYGQCNVPSPNADFVAVVGGLSSQPGAQVRRDDRGLGGQRATASATSPRRTPTSWRSPAGWDHSLGLKSDGTIVAWGDNDYGQCNVPSPNAGFVAVAAGGYHSLGLKSDGTIVAWGCNGDGQCNVPSPNADFVAIAAGGYHSLGLRGLPDLRCIAHCP